MFVNINTEVEIAKNQVLLTISITYDTTILIAYAINIIIQKESRRAYGKTRHLSKRQC